MEGTSINGYGGPRPVRLAVEKSIGRHLSDEEYYLLELLQGAHDSSSHSDFVGIFSTKCKEIAEKFELEWKF